MAKKWNDLSDMDVWATETKFDFDKFKGLEARVKLCAVPWDRKWKNVVDWKSDEERDHYFEQLDGQVFDTATNWNFQNLEVWKAGLGRHVGELPMDLPYANTIDFNYVFIELYETPVPGADLPRREVYCYFLPGLTSKNPSTTNLALELDSWTTYRPSFELKAINLRRGHYFHAATSSEDFLANPLENNFGVTAPEPELPDLQPKVGHTKLVSFAESSPRVCIATTADITDRRSWFTVIPNSPTENPDGRAVNFPPSTRPGSMDTEWNQGYDVDRGEASHYATQGLKTAVKQQTNGNGTTESLNVYSMDPYSFTRFIEFAKQSVQQILPSIKAVYVLDSAVIEESEEFNQWGYNFRKVSQSSDPKLLSSFKPTKSMFDYTQEESRFAKLYTGQFAKIEVSNLQGGRAEIAIEEIAETLDVYSRSSTLFPYLKLQALIDGVGGKGIKRYVVKPMNQLSASSFNSRWEDFSFDLDIPVFGIFIAKDQEIGQATKTAREQSARSTKAKLDLRVDIAQKEAMSTFSTLMTSNTNRHADLTTTLYNRRDSNSLSFNNAFTSLESEQLIGNTEAERSKYTESVAVNTSLQIANLQAESEKLNAQASASTGIANASSSANIARQIAKENAATENTNTLSSVQVPYDLWYNVDRLILVDNYSGDLFRANTAYEQNFIAKADFFKVSNDIANTSSAMGIVTAARIAGFGAVGSGLASIPAATIGSSFQALGRGMTSAESDKATAPALGVAGLTLVSLLQQSIAYDINNLAWKLQVAQTNMTSGEGRIYAGVDAGEGNGNDKGWIEYEGPSMKGQEWKTNFEIAYQAMLNVRYELKRDYDRTRQSNDAEANTNLAVEKANASRTLNQANLSADHAHYGALTVATNSLNAATEILNRTYDTSIDNNQSAFDSSNTIIDANFSYATGIVSTRYGTGMTNAVRSRDVDKIILERDFTTGGIINQAIYSDGIRVLGKTQDVANQSAGVDYSLERGAWTADFLTAVQGEPSKYGEDGGAAWVDIWGSRGLEIRVHRCTDAVAKQAATLFSLYGYRNEGYFVQDPEVNLMSHFTYWEGSDAWISGDRINESNKEIMRAIFDEGVFIWNSPELILNVDVTTNQVRQEEA